MLNEVPACLTLRVNEYGTIVSYKCEICKIDWSGGKTGREHFCVEIALANHGEEKCYVECWKDWE